MKKYTLLCFFGCLMSFNVHAQLIVDLSDDQKKEEAIDLDRIPEVLVKNMLPSDKYKYEVRIEKTEEKIPAFDLEILNITDSGKDSAIEAAKKKLEDATQESDVPELIKKLKEELAKLSADEAQKYTVAVNKLIEKTTYTAFIHFALKENQTIKVSVKKTMSLANGSDSSYTWVRIFKTPTKTPWSFLYGFTFVPNMMNPVANYYSKADTSGKQFEITHLNNNKKEYLKNISPTLMFTWKPMTKYSHSAKSFLSNNFYQVGFVAGISLNFASETGIVNVMAGPSIIIADNVSLSAGVALTQKSVLKGQYKEGDIVKENLDFDQLHEKKYMTEWFVSIAFRFEQNPFKKEDKK
jgi:ribosomal protein S20